MGSLPQALSPLGRAEARNDHGVNVPSWGGLQDVRSRPGGRACAPRRAGGGRACRGPWDAGACGRSAPRGRRAAAQPAQRGPGPAPPLGLSPPRGSSRRTAFARAPTRCGRCLPPPLMGSRLSPGARSGRGRGVPGAKSQARGGGGPSDARAGGGDGQGLRLPLGPLPSPTEPGILRHRFWGAPFPYPSQCPVIQAWGGRECLTIRLGSDPLQWRAHCSPQE